VNAPEKYQIVKRDPADKRLSKWRDLREKLRGLPDGASIRISVPKGETLRSFAQKIRTGIGRSGKIQVTVSENTTKGVVEVWEKRQPYNQI
jgi:hypothetical protein